MARKDEAGGSACPSATKDFGSNILKAPIYPIIKIRSAGVPDEFNYLLNPAYADSKYFTTLRIRDFLPDVHIKFHNIKYGRAYLKPTARRNVHVLAAITYWVIFTLIA